jgi:hypothetical protein
MENTDISMVNAGIEDFVRAAAPETKRSIREDAVSPVWVKETSKALGLEILEGMSAEQVVLAHRESVEEQRNGEAVDVGHFV